MAVTISAANLPQFDGATGVPGKRRVLYVNYGVGATEKKPVWVLVGRAEDFTMSPTVNTQSKTTKDSGGWETSAATTRKFEVSSKLVAKVDDEGQKVLEAFVYDDDCNAKNALQFAYVDLDTKNYKEFKAIPTSFEETSSADDLVESSFKATGTGKVELKNGFTVTTSSSGVGV